MSFFLFVLRNAHAVDGDVLTGLLVFVHGGLADGIHHVHALVHLPQHGIGVVKIRRAAGGLIVRNHLRAVARAVHLVHKLLRHRLVSRQRLHHVKNAGALAGSIGAHTQGTGIMVQAVGGLSRVAAAVPDGTAPAVGPLPGFHHKAALHAGEGQAVVVACLHKARKVIIGLRGFVREKHRLEHACRVSGLHTSERC